MNVTSAFFSVPIKVILDTTRSQYMKGENIPVAHVTIRQIMEENWQDIRSQHMKVESINVTSAVISLQKNVVSLGILRIYMGQFYNK